MRCQWCNGNLRIEIRCATSTEGEFNPSQQKPNQFRLCLYEGRRDVEWNHSHSTWQKEIFLGNRG